MSQSNQKSKAEQFKSLHLREGIFILANAWDVASALIFEKAGYPAIGTTSAGFAATMGYPDGEKINLNDYLAFVSRICLNSNLPVNADIEAGYGDNIEQVLSNVQKFIQAGASGINIEDVNHKRSKNGKALNDISYQTELIKAIKHLTESIDVPIVINSRSDAYWLNVGNNKTEMLRNVINRLNSYGEAGADCVFPPGDLSYDEIKLLVTEIPYPLNIVIRNNIPSVKELDEIGVKRLSMGSSPMRAALGLTQKIATGILKTGTYEKIIDNEIDYFDIQQLFSAS